SPESGASKPRRIDRPVCGVTGAARLTAGDDEPPLAPSAGRTAQPHSGGQSAACVVVSAPEKRRPSDTDSGTNASTSAPSVAFASLWSREQPLSSVTTYVGFTSSDIEYEMPRFTTEGGLMPSVERSIVCLVFPPPRSSVTTVTVSVP